MNSAHLESWIGRAETQADEVHASIVAAMSATLNLAGGLLPGSPLPPGWQWLFFNPVVRAEELGEDGHPARGGFLPPVPLPRRMWAGSRIRYLRDLPIGASATRNSRIQKVEPKSGKRGALCFVTVEHTITHDGTLCIVEEQDIVYKEATTPGAPLPIPQPYTEQPQWSYRVSPDTTLLFRYSALTFNGHRIHYDLPYARDVEGYAGLVVHGPLTATLLQQFVCQHARGRRLATFEFRGVSPLLEGRPFQLEAKDNGDGSFSAWARGPHGELAMSATATFA